MLNLDKNIFTGKKIVQDVAISNNQASSLFWCNDNDLHKRITNRDDRTCCLMHMNGLPRDAVTREEIPLSKEQVEFAGQVLTQGNQKQMTKDFGIALKKRSEVEKRKEIKKIVASILPDLEEGLPEVPKDRLEWENTCRPIIKGMQNRLKYMPMLKKVIYDHHPFKFFLWGRQWGKTTMLASDLAFTATTNHDYDQTYLNFNEAALSTFTENKFRNDVFGSGVLMNYIYGFSRLGSKNKVVLKTRSIIDMILPGDFWCNTQGKSNKRMIIDEGQDHNWDGFQNARETQADTMGETIVAGIGGDIDTAYHKLWQSTNQMKWIFKDGGEYEGYSNSSWRKNLRFDSKGLVYGDYLNDVLAGEWVAEHPEIKSRHGYHLSQLDNPRIPLTKKDAIEKYKVSDEWSIEYKLKDTMYTNVEYRKNVLAEFVAGDIKPITTRDMNLLFDDKLFPLRVDDELFSFHDGPVFVGIDWGGGGKTIIWVWQLINEDGPIFRLLFAKKIETPDVEKQKDFCISIIDEYQADQIVVDAGGGIRQVQALQARYGRSCIRTEYSKRPERPLPTREEFQKLKREMRYRVDRTYAIDRIIELIKHTHEGRRRIILPGGFDGKVNHREESEWIVKQFVALEAEKIPLKSTGQLYTSYGHKDSEPDDALHACIYANIAYDLFMGRATRHYSANIEYTPSSFVDEDFR